MAAPESERGLACLAYLFLWLTGLIILLTAKKEEKYKRWHAIQAIALGIVVVIVYIVVNILVNILFSASGTGAFGPSMAITGIVNLAVLILIIFLMVKTYQGTTIRLPGLAGFADKSA
jgi:uncharacterized membrane protein